MMTRHLALAAALALAVIAIPPLSAAGTITLNDSSDAYYTFGNATNFGAATTLPVNMAAPGASVTLIQFNLLQLPAGLTAGDVSNATLSLWVTGVGTAGSVDVALANGAWTELTVNGTSGFPAPGAVLGSLPVSSSGQYVSLDLTSAVQGWLTNPASNNGVMITVDIANLFTNVTFASRENSDNHPPILQVTSPKIVPPVPEPSSLLLLGTGLIGAAGAIRRKVIG